MIHNNCTFYGVIRVFMERYVCMTRNDQAEVIIIVISLHIYVYFECSGSLTVLVFYKIFKPGIVVHTNNPSTVGGCDRKIVGLNPAQEI